MDIHFCSVCQESIPVPDLAAGRAVQRGKGFVCAACERAMGATAPEPAGHPAPAATEPPAAEAAHPASLAAGAAAPAAPRPARAGLYAACLALGGVAYLWWQARESAERAFAARAVDRQRTEQLALEAGELGRELAALRSTLGDERVAARGAADGAARRVDELQAQLADARAGVSALARRADEADRLRERVELLGALAPRLQDMEVKLRALVEERTALVARVAELEAALKDAAQRTTVVPSNEQAGPGAPTRPGWDTRLADLTSPSEATRLEAVLALSATKDPAVVPHLVPRLKDENLFVRTATARALGELRVLDQPAALALCDALLDEAPPVREAAWVALRATTGLNLAYDPLGSDAERLRRAKAWREQVEKGPQPAGTGAHGG